MATKKQVQANRKNANKSTGPKTPEGKAKSAQNATTHGLTASSDVIKGESQEQFDAQRNRLFDELAPQTLIQEILTDRIATLAWRLKRAERMQNQFADAMLLDHPFIVEYLACLNRAPSNHNPDLDLGATIKRDFRGDKVLDRLKLYERRIENSLFKSLNQLQKRKRQKPLDPMLEYPNVQDHHIDSASQDAQDLISLCKGSSNLYPRPSGVKKQTQSTELRNGATSDSNEPYNLHPRGSGAPSKPIQAHAAPLTDHNHAPDSPRRTSATVRRY